MINSLDTEQSFWQNPTSHHDENPGETRGERDMPQHNKGKRTPSHTNTHIIFTKI